MIKTMFLVPTKDNDGQPFGRRDWQELEQKLLRFGGFTSGGVVEGSWEADGRVYRDRSRTYIVSLESWTQLPEWLDVVRWVRATFRQEAVYIEIAGIPEIIGEG